jgi:tRNA dimethylallyltransferase
MCGGEIISADSRQVYRGMDIGTGKDLEEYGEVPYHLINIADAGEKYNLFRYQRDFREAYESIVARGKRAILCGGTGLYIDAVTGGYSLPEVPVNPELRAALEMKSLGELAEMLAGMKPMHNTTDVDSKKRAIRAIEIEIYKEQNPGILEYTSAHKLNTRFIGIEIDREERNARIDRRLKERLQNGMTEEVRQLLESGISPEDLIYYGLEYKFVTLYITGQLSYEEMENQLAVAIHQFAKRQMTWFRGMERRGVKIEWVSPEWDRLNEQITRILNI